MNPGDYLRRLGIAGGRTKTEIQAAIAGFSDKSDTRCQSLAVELAILEMAEAANAENLEAKRELSQARAEVTRLRVELQLVRRGAEDCRGRTAAIESLRAAISPFFSPEQVDCAELALRPREGRVFITSTVGAVLDARSAWEKAGEAVK